MAEPLPSDSPLLDPIELHVDPIERAFTIPSAWYTDERFHVFDIEHLFAPSWQFAGHVNQLAEPGQYILAEAAGNPIILVRDKEGEIRAFYNVCRHRGGPLETEPCGRVSMLQCKYHGWTFRLDGMLRGVPRFNRVDLFNKEDYGLLPVEWREWQGLVFVRSRPGCEDLDVMLDGIADRVAPISLLDLHFAGRQVCDVACNWKTYVDNYLEGYHLPYVHPDLCDVLDVQAYDTDTYPHYSVQHSTLDDAGAVYGSEAGAAYYIHVFPNFMMNIIPGRLQTNIVVPTGPETCRVIFDYFYEECASPEANTRIENDQRFSDQVQQEDMLICEHVQRGLATEAYDQGRFSVECEQGVYHFQVMLKQAYGKALST